MSWTDVYKDIEQNDQTQATFDYKSLTLDENTTQVWVAISDTVEVTPNEAAVASGIPSTYAVYNTIGGNFGFLVSQVLCKRDSSDPFKFDCQITFNRKISFQPEGQDKWACSINIDGQEYVQDAFQDKDSNPIQNSAGEPFDPTLKRTFNDEVINVKYKTLTPPDLSALRGKVCNGTVSFTIQGFSKSYSERQLKLKAGSMSTTYVDGTTDNNPVWDVALQFLARTDTFVDTVVDQGYYQRDTSTASPNLCGALGGGGPPTGKRIEITDDFGSNLSAPSRLDGHGKLLNVGGGAAIYLCFPIEAEADFSSLFSGLS